MHLFLISFKGCGGRKIIPSFEKCPSSVELRPWTMCCDILWLQKHLLYLDNRCVCMCVCSDAGKQLQGSVMSPEGQMHTPGLVCGKASFVF